MAFDIFTYGGTKVTVDVDIESDEITDAAINVYSGDEVLCIGRKGSSKVEIYDSAVLAGVFREFEFYDGMTTIKRNGVLDEVWDNPAFRMRERSDWYWND